MFVLKRISNKVLEKINTFKIKTYYKNYICLGKNVRLHKRLELNFESTNSRLVIGNNFYARNDFCVRICNDGRLVIGNTVFFNNACSITCFNSISIGDYCIFGENVKIYDHNHIYSDKSKPIAKQGMQLKEVVIGDNCWIGSNVTILAGVHIGQGCVIGAGCVVYKDLPENTILYSNGFTKER